MSERQTQFDNIDLHVKQDAEEWWQSAEHPFAVVSNFPTGHDDRFSIEEYGGHLVCESICKQSNMDKILALPALLEAVKNLLAPYSQDTGRLTTPEMTALQKAYNDAIGFKIEVLKKELQEAEEPYKVEHAESTDMKVVAAYIMNDDIPVAPLPPEAFEETESTPVKSKLKIGDKIRTVPMSDRIGGDSGNDVGPI